jgi:hypothetical protein
MISDPILAFKLYLAAAVSVAQQSSEPKRPVRRVLIEGGAGMPLANPRSMRAYPKTGQEDFDNLFLVETDKIGLVTVTPRNAGLITRPQCWVATSRSDMQKVIDTLCKARDDIFPHERAHR